MADWQAASTITAALTPLSAVAPDHGNAASEAQPSSGVPPVLPHFFCTCCGTIIPADQLVHINGRAICAACKPNYLQQIQEGLAAPLKAPVLDAAGMAMAGTFAADTATMAYAGFWIRVLAALVDAVVMWTVSLGTHMATGESFAAATGFDGSDWTTRDTLLFGMDNLIDLIYETIMVAKFGGTLGKLLCRIRVVTATGQRLGYGHSFLRALAQWVSLVPCGMGFVLAAFDRQKRALHDFICNTRVIWAK